MRSTSLQVVESYRDLDPGPLHSLLVLAGNAPVFFFFNLLMFYFSRDI
jgi:hypothetical protein